MDKTTKITHKSSIVAGILQGIMRESRVFILYTVPPAGLICALKYWELDASLLISLITGMFFVIVVIMEDYEAVDTKFTAFIARILTALGWYHGAWLGSYYVFQQLELDKRFVDTELYLLLFQLLSQYCDFIGTIGLTRVYFNAFLAALHLIAKFAAGVLAI